MESIKDVCKETIVYVDESGIDSYLYNPYGWSAQGKKVYGEVSGRRFARESFIAALCNGKIISPLCYQGTCNTEIFNMWVEDFLVPCLRPGQIIILDNATFHKSEKTKKLIEEAGCTLIFLPPYSPDLNPIETFWANLKAKVRSIISEIPTIQEAIDHAFNMFIAKVL